MADRQGVSSRVRFPYRYTNDGEPLCRWCGTIMDDKRRTFCGPRCVRDFKLVTDWQHVRKVVYERDDGICMKCGKGVTRDDYHVDHIVPLAAGGDEWDLDNLELSCPTCNLSKGAKIQV